MSKLAEVSQEAIQNQALYPIGVVAELLNISVKTSIGHRTNIMKKLDIHNLSELIKYAMRKHPIDLNEQGIVAWPHLDGRHI